MDKKLVRVILLSTQVLISGVLFYLFLLCVFGNAYSQIGSSVALPIVIQTVSNLVFAFIFFFTYKTSSLVDLQLTPFLLLSSSLENFRLINIYSAYTFNQFIPTIWVNYIVQFALVFSVLLFCGFSFLPQTRSYISVSNYIFLALGTAFLFTFFSPSIDLTVYIVVGLYIITIISYAISLITYFHTFNVLKQISLMVLSGGNCIMAISHSTWIAYFGSLSFVVSETVLCALLIASSKGYASRLGANIDSENINGTLDIESAG